MQRTIYFDYLRVIACFAVIVLHVSAMQIQNYSVPTIEWNVINLYDSATRFCVPIFLMISGALFLNPSKELYLYKLYTRNILRIIVALFFWSFIYACYNYKLNGEFSFLTLLLYGEFHMWFLWLIVGFYVLVPLLRPIVENKLTLEYFLITSFVFSFVVPFIFKITELFIPALTSIVELGKIYCDNLQLQMLSGFAFYFVLGYYLHISTIKRIIENELILFGIFSGICIACLTYYVFRSTGVIDLSFYEYESFFVLFETIAVFLLVKRLCNVESRIVSSISKLSFGIYLVHMLVYYMIGMTSTTIIPLIGIPLLSILVFIASYTISFVLSRVPLLNKWII